MRVQEVHLFENTAPGGSGGFVANVSVRIDLSEQTYEDAVAKLTDALADFALPGNGAAEPVTRRRAAAPAAPAEEPAAEAPARRRRAAAPAAPAEEPEATPDAPRRRRRTAEAADEPKGPTKEDVAKAASALAEKCGTKLAAEIIVDFSPNTGKIDDIPADRREAFIDEAAFQMSDD